MLTPLQVGGLGRVDTVKGGRFFVDPGRKKFQRSKVSRSRPLTPGIRRESDGGSSMAEPAGWFDGRVPSDFRVLVSEETQ